MDITGLIIKTVPHRLRRLAGKLIPRTFDIGDSPERFLAAISPRICNSCIAGVPSVISHEVDLMIVVPCYNVEDYVAECIDSILAQDTSFTYRIVAVNDGSTDRTADILARYADRPEVLVITQSNRGFSGARNRALEHISGHHLMFVDSDDRLPRGAIQALMTRALETDADIVQGAAIKFDGNRTVDTMIPAPGEVFGYPWGKVYRSSLFTNIRFPEKYWFEDTIVNFILYYASRGAVSIPEITYEYRRNTKGITHTSKGLPKLIDTLWITMQLAQDHSTLFRGSDDASRSVAIPFPDTLLAQIRHNAIRLRSFHDRRIDYANFLISCALIKQYCPADDSQPSRLPMLEAALRQADFREFMTAVYLKR
ncbi:MAG: glycosyltransferase family 2 protein [Muribaculaceae bacterium]|nr:glycosyltransferase family 2 protein [Muribaculaceae bacterium]